MRRREFITLFGGAATAWSFVAHAQQMASPGPAFMHVVQQPYDIESWGEFRRMMMSGDFSPKIKLSEVMARRPSIGVGAVADARGEITICDGKLIVSYGKAGTQPDRNSESAALLAIGSTGDWQIVAVERDVAPPEIETYVAAAAKARGIDMEKSFPFEVRGTLASYVMHVNAAPTNGLHGMGQPMAITVVSQGERIDGGVAGLYVSADLMGVATHGGERTHAHWVSPDGNATAHLDAWGLKSGAMLMLPKS